MGEQPHDQPPAPGAVPSAVYENESSHVLPPFIAADFTPVHAFVKIPANIRTIVAIAELGTVKPKKLVAGYFKLGDNAGVPDEQIAKSGA